MNSVQITEQKNTVTVNETTNTVTVTEGIAATVQIATEGPQGPSGNISGLNFNVSGKVNDALLYYHAASDTFKADSTTTKLTLVDGGNF
tara:strand:- start:2117 stop:2383 length:267 start_codon:yes stop_codon:yes gene_type:complete